MPPTTYHYILFGKANVSEKKLAENEVAKGTERNFWFTDLRITGVRLPRLSVKWTPL